MTFPIYGKKHSFLVAKFGKSQANCDCIVPSSGGSTKPLKERPKSAEIEVKLIGKCGSPAKLPKTEPASTRLQWLDACDPLPTIAAKLQQRHCSIIEYYIPLLVPLKTP